MTEEEALKYMAASQLTVDSITKGIEEMGVKPRADEVQELLNEITSIGNAEQRAILFATAKQCLKDGALKSLVTAAMKEATKASKGKQREPFTPATSQLPAPQWATKGYAKHRDRVYAFGTNKDGESVPLHTPLHVRAGLTYPDRVIQGMLEKQGVLVEFENAAGDICKLPYLRSDALLAPKEGMIADLANAGVSFTPLGIDAFRNGVLETGIAASGIIYDYPGWRGENTFVTPGGEIVGESNRDVGLANPLRDVCSRGTLEGWLSGVAPAFCQEMLEKAPHVPATLLWGFVSPLLDRAKEEMSLVLCITGRTTNLKTFGQRMMASVWGGVEPAAGILVTFSATPNRLEEYAIERSGCGLPVDESTLMDPVHIVKFVYRIVTGVERGRMGETPRRWRVACVLSSEVPLEQLILAAGEEPPPGLMSRLVQIPVTGERVSDDIVDRMRTVADPKHLKHFGHAGPKFVRQMLDGGYDADRITREVGVKVSEIIGGEGDREQQRRASRGLAYLWLAADIAKEAQLVPGDFDVRSFILGLWEKVKGGADTTKGVVGKVCSSLSTGLRSGDIAIYSRKGDALSSGDGAVCFEEFGPEKVPAFVLSQAALGRLVGSRETVVDAAKILAEAGLIYREQSDRLYWRSGRAGVGNVSSYAIYARAVLGDDANDIIERHRSVRADKPGGHSGGG